MVYENGWLTRAQRIADEVFFPSAMAVEQADRVPAAHLDLLAAEGFYGIAAPVEFGGAGPEALPVVGDVIAALAGGCLTTTFVWLQHLAPLMAVAAVANPEDRARWLDPLARGRVRTGLAMARPELIRARAVPGGFRLTGESAWVTSWGMIDVLLVGAVDDRDVIHFFLMDACGAPTLVARPTELIAVQASRTVSLRFDDHFVPADRLGLTRPFGEWARSDFGGSALNGFLSIGVAGRCARLIGADDLEPELADARTRLLTAAPDEVPQARADATLLAARAAARLMVHTGSRSVLAGEHAGRLFRESGFLLVFGSRPAIKQELLHRLSVPPVCVAV